MGISFGGVLAGAVGGAGQAVEQIGQSQIDQNNKMSLMKATQEAETDRQKALLQAQSDIKEQERQRMVGAISGRAGQIATDNQTQGLNNFYNSPNSDGTAPAQVTALANGDVSDQEKAMNPITSANMDSARVQAAKELGYVHPDTQATTDAAITRANITSDWRTNNAAAGVAGRANVANINVAGRQDVADTNADSREAVADTRAKAYREKVAAMGQPDKAALQHAHELTIDMAKATQSQSKVEERLITLTGPALESAKADIQAYKVKVAEAMSKREAIYAKIPSVRDAAAFAPSGDPSGDPTSPAASAPTASGVQSALQKYRASQQNSGQ